MLIIVTHAVVVLIVLFHFSPLLPEIRAVRKGNTEDVSTLPPFGKHSIGKKNDLNFAQTSRNEFFDFTDCVCATKRCYSVYV